MTLAWMVTLETPNFSFKAFGQTEEEANETMGRALKRHEQQYDLPEDWWSAFDFETTEIESGTAFRDGEPLVHP